MSDGKALQVDTLFLLG